MVLQQEIDPKSLTLEGLGTLGIKVIVLAFTCLRNQLDLKND
jgi:hypothetical protein